MAKAKIRVKVTGKLSDTAYLKLPGFPDGPPQGVVSRTICLAELIKEFKGPQVNLDFNEQGVLIGIEVLVSRISEH